LGTIAKETLTASVDGFVQPTTTTFNANEIPKVLKIGDYYAGGIIFYLDGTGQHGEVFANTLGSGLWDACNTHKATGATGTAIGTGASNTNILINVLGIYCSIATASKNYKGGGYSDWFLPSRDELHLVFINLALTGIVDFTNIPDPYWSSSEIDNTTAWRVSLTDGVESMDDKSDNVNVLCAVRAF